MPDSHRPNTTREERAGRALAVLVTLLALLALAEVGAEQFSVEAARPIGRSTPASASMSGSPASSSSSLSARLEEPTAAAAALRDGHPMDLNAASAAELTLLPGIGPAIAGRIVAHRDAEGPFRSVAGLEAVRGVGPRTRARVEALVMVAGSAE